MVQNAIIFDVYRIKLNTTRVELKFEQCRCTCFVTCLSLIAETGNETATYAWWPCQLTFYALKYFKELQKIYLHFLLSPDPEMAQVVGNLPHGQQRPVCPTWPLRSQDINNQGIIDLQWFMWNVPDPAPRKIGVKTRKNVFSGTVIILPFSENVERHVFVGMVTARQAYLFSS